MLKVGVIGLGNMGWLHLLNCFHIDDIKVIAAADQSKSALKRAESIGVSKLFTDYHDLLNNPSSFDAVIVSVPNFLHYESVQLALEAGVDVFVEKPLAKTPEECREILNSVKKSGRRLMVGHCMRFLEAVEKIKDKTDKGHLGSLEVITAEEIYNGPFAHPAVPKPVPEWWFDPSKTGGGVLIDIGYHMIDLFRFFAGESKVIYSCLDHRMNLPMEDSAIVILQSQDSSVKGIINVGWYQKLIFPNFNFRFIVHGNSGFASTDELIPKNLYLHAAKEGTKNLFRKFIGKKIRPLSYTYYSEQYFKELQTFFNCLKKDTDPPVTAIDGLRTLETIQEAYDLAGLSKTERSVTNE
jgi:predicted dehydrogenase